VSPDVLVDTDAVLVGVLEAELQGRKQSPGTRDGQGDESEFPNDFLPFAQAHAALTPQLVKQGLDAGFAVFRELNGLGQSVDDPSQHKLSGPPRPVPLQQLL
jgi:hypothetical protein